MHLVGVRVRHPWIDSKMRVVGYSQITSEDNWIASEVKLGDAVSRVVKNLQLDPPDVMEIMDQALKKMQAHSGSCHQRTEESKANNFEESSSFLNLPPVPISFPDLDTMSKIELENLSNDNPALDAYLDKMEAVKMVKDLSTSIYKGNLETAECNLKKKEDAETLHAECEALSATFHEKLADFQILEQQQNKIFKPCDTKEVVQRLRKAKKESGNESEELALRWIDNGGMDIDEFVDQFLEKRIIHHERAAKLERLQYSS